MVGRICPYPPGGDMIKVSENLGATTVVPVAPVDTSLSNSVFDRKDWMPRNRNILILPTKPNRKLMDSQRIAFLFSKEEYFSKSILDLVKRKKGMIKQEKWGGFFLPWKYWPCTRSIGTITLYTRSTSVGWNNVWRSILILIKFIYSEKATKFCEIFTLLLSYVVPVKSKVKISQKFVAFSEYINFRVKTIW